jgi:predicted dinucleotide-binding enzyme
MVAPEIEHSSIFPRMANIAVLGTGMVAKAITGKLASLGHSVKMGTRDPEATLARADKDPIRPWLEARPNISLATYADAAAHGSMVFSALNGQASVSVVKDIADRLDGKVLVDISNPLDFSKGFPPSLTVSNTDSLGEQVQRAAPKAKVVKTLNTVNASLMVDAKSLAGDHSMFVCGNDAGAKHEVMTLLKEGFGWGDVIDLGDITSARGTEMYLPLWLRLMGALKTATFNVKVVR